MLMRWADFWQTLTPDSLEQVNTLCDPKVRFVDPFNDLTGVAPLRHLLVHMFETLDAPKFHVRDIAAGTKAGYLRWDFSARLRQRPITLSGMSEVHFSDTGQVVLHHDHWDASTQVYTHVPVLGSLIRLVRRRLSVAACPSKVGKIMDRKVSP